MKINKHTTIFLLSECSSPVTYALKGLIRDMSRIFGQEPEVTDRTSRNQIRLQAASFDHEEEFRIQSTNDYILIEGGNGLGLVFGIYHFCEHHLCVDPYEFWTDHPLKLQDEIDLPAFTFTSPVPKVRFRGWFINDEDCLIGWHDDMRISLATWEQIFETLLRAGYNMIIPGTGISASDPQLQLASEMGLWITQHHAEPLGASMFSDVFSGDDPAIPEDKERFVELYKEAIAQYKDKRVIWALGFRGQGDHSFFENDPRYDTPQKRGALISEMVELQKNLVLQMTDSPQYFVHYLYAESAELYH
ncbi:MAG: glycosyl hydrolase 115 family protein, partial [Chloroflexota bacterium]